MKPFQSGANDFNIAIYICQLFTGMGFMMYDIPSVILPISYLTLLYDSLPSHIFLPSLYDILTVTLTLISQYLPSSTFCPPLPTSTLPYQHLPSQYLPPRYIGMEARRIETARVPLKWA